MNCKRLIVSCDKCGGYAQPHSPWLTSDKQLMIRSVCINCGKGIETFYPLTDLFKSCPVPDLKELDETLGQQIEQIADNASSQPVEITPQDEEWLISLGIKVPSIKFAAP